jgi:hypothetical protein
VPPFERSWLEKVCSHLCLFPYCCDDFFDIALRQASDKLPTTMEFVNRSTPPRLGRLVVSPPKKPDSLKSLVDDEAIHP